MRMSYNVRLILGAVGLTDACRFLLNGLVRAAGGGSRGVSGMTGEPKMSCTE